MRPHTKAGPFLTVYLVTDRRRLAPDARTTADEIRALDAWLEDAIHAGVDVIQIRERDLSARDLTRVLDRCARLAASRPTRVLVNDRADVAVAGGAGGVHLRADGPATARVQSVGPDSWLVGRSTHTRSEVEAAQDADYLLFGPVFRTVSKPDRAVAAGLDELRAVAKGSGVPVVAIGGIDVETAGACLEAGAAGVAAIGMFLAHGPSDDEPALSARVRRLRTAIGTRQC